MSDRGALGRDKQPDRIAGMFDAIAPRYDLLNHLLSAGMDLRWRAKAIRVLALRGGETVLDRQRPRWSSASTFRARCSGWPLRR